MESLSQVVAAPAILAMGLSNAVQAGFAEMHRQRALDASAAADIHGAAANAWANAAGDAQAELIGAQARISQLERLLDRSERAHRQFLGKIEILLDATPR